MLREHELFQPGLENTHAGQNNPNPHRYPVEVSTQAALEVLERTNIRRLAAILDSRRRVNAIMDGVGIVCPARFADSDLLYRIPDVHFDLKSFTGLDLGSTQIEYQYRTIMELEAVFSNLAPAKVRRLPPEIKGRIANDGILELAARTWVERVIWDRWTPEGENASEIAVSLKTTVVNSLYHFPSFVKAYINGERPKYGTFLLNERASCNSPLVEALDEWYTNVSDLKIWQVFYLIENLDPRLKCALLDRFGYLHPGERAQERLVRYQISREALRGDFIRAVREVSKLMSASHLTGREFPSQDIASIVKETEESPIYRMNGRVLHHDSPRIFLLRLKDNPALMEKLSPAERQILTLATQLEGDRFINTDKTIADKTGLSPDSVGALITIIMERVASKEPRFFYKNGYTISPNSDHYFLIEIRDLLYPEQLAALCLSTGEFLDQLTTPDKNGQYPMAIEVEGNLGKNFVIRRVISALENYGWIVSLREKIEQVLLEHREKFSDEEIEIMKYILESIREGKPLKSKNGRGICWTAICKTLHKHPNRGSFLSIKLKRLGN